MLGSQLCLAQSWSSVQLPASCIEKIFRHNTDSQSNSEEQFILEFIWIQTAAE